MSSGEQRVEALQEFSRVLGRLLGRRWLRQQVESVDAQELPAAIRRLLTTVENGGAGRLNVVAPGC